MESKSKPYVPGMYVEHREYSAPKLSNEQRRAVQRDQHLAVERKREVERNVRHILAGTGRR